MFFRYTVKITLTCCHISPEISPPQQILISAPALRSGFADDQADFADLRTPAKVRCYQIHYHIFYISVHYFRKKTLLPITFAYKCTLRTGGHQPCVTRHYLYFTVEWQCRSMHVGSASMRWISTSARDCWEAGLSCWCRYRTRRRRDRSIWMTPFE